MHVQGRRSRAGASALRHRGAPPATFKPTFAAAAQDLDARFLTIILRDGLDGLSVVPMDGPNAVLPLDGFFAFNARMTYLHRLYRGDQGLILHAGATVAFLLGGAVADGRVVTDWPGLTETRLYQNRDLALITDLRAALKGVLADHLGLPAWALGERVFPGSASVVGMAGLVRA